MFAGSVSTETTEPKAMRECMLTWDGSKFTLDRLTLQVILRLHRSNPERSISQVTELRPERPAPPPAKFTANHEMGVVGAKRHFHTVMNSP